MPTYNVTWEIDIDADTPEEAAREARRYQREGTWVGVFNVFDERGDGHHVDLDELDQEKGQDRESYTDEQDREGYIVSDDAEQVNGKTWEELIKGG